MALRDLRPLIEQPFRNFATFSGRAGRGEYWLLILSVIILTNIAWLVGYGGMKLAGYPGHHDGTSSGHHGSETNDGRSRHLFTVSKDRRTTAGDGAGILKGLVTLALAVPLLAAGARRLHDTSKLGWWRLFVLIPLAGWLVLLIFILLPGETDENRFEPPPGKD